MSHISTDSDPFGDSPFSADRFSLDNVMLEYDNIMEKYSNRAITPDFDTNTETGSSTGRTASGSLSSDHSESMSHTSTGVAADGFQPIPDLVSQLNSNCNHSRPRSRKGSGPKKSVKFALNTKDSSPNEPPVSPLRKKSESRSEPQSANLPPGAISKPLSLAFQNDQNDELSSCDDMESEQIFARFSNEIRVPEASKASPEIDRLTPDTLDERTEQLQKDFALQQHQQQIDPNAQVSIGVVRGRNDSSETNNSESVSDSTVNSNTIDISVLPEIDQPLSPTSSMFSQSPPSNGGPISVQPQTLDSPDKLSPDTNLHSDLSPQDIVFHDKRAEEFKVDHEGACCEQYEVDKVSSEMQGDCGESLKCEREDSFVESPVGSTSGGIDLLPEDAVVSSQSDILVPLQHDESILNDIVAPSQDDAVVPSHHDGNMVEDIASSSQDDVVAPSHDQDDVPDDCNMTNEPLASPETMSQDDILDDRSDLLEEPLSLPACDDLVMDTPEEPLQSPTPESMIHSDVTETSDLQDDLPVSPSELASEDTCPSSPIINMQVEETADDVAADEDVTPDMHCEANDQAVATRRNEDSSSASDVVEL